MLNRGGFSNADVLLVPSADGSAVIVKDYSRRSWFLRHFVAPLQVKHELAMLEHLEGLPGVPAPRGRVDRLALAMEYIEGLPLRRRSHRAALPRAFFDGLEGILQGLALRGVVYVDLRSATNVLSTSAGDAPALVDLASAYRVPLPRVLLQWWDRRGMRKLRRRFEGELGEARVHSEPADYDELDMGDVRMSFLDRGRVDDSVPVVFLHDVGLSAELFRPLVEGAAAQRRRALAVDLPGFARSPWSARRLSPARVVRRLEAWLDALRIARVDLVGYGWGGLLARWLAVRSPERVRVLLTLDTPLRRLEGRWGARWSEAGQDPELLRRRLLRELPAELTAAQRASLTQTLGRTPGPRLVQAYRGLPLRRRGRRGIELRLALPEQPWLAVRGEPIEADAPAMGSRSREECWPSLLADPTRVWKALDQLASVVGSY